MWMSRHANVHASLRELSLAHPLCAYTHAHKPAGSSSAARAPSLETPAGAWPMSRSQRLLEEKCWEQECLPPSIPANDNQRPHRNLHLPATLPTQPLWVEPLEESQETQTGAKDCPMGATPLVLLNLRTTSHSCLSDKAPRWPEQCSLPAPSCSVPGPAEAPAGPSAAHVTGQLSTTRPPPPGSPEWLVLPRLYPVPLCFHTGE